MDKYDRKNTENSYFLVVYDDTDEYEAGIYCIVEKKKPNSNAIEKQKTYICSLAYIEFKLNVETKIFYKIVYYDRDSEKELIVSGKELLSISKDNLAINLMLDNGFLPSEKCSSLILEYFKTSAQYAPEKLGTEITGWRDSHYIAKGFNTSPLQYAGRSRVVFSRSGTFEGQRDFLKGVFSENPLVFFVCAFSLGGIIAKHVMPGEANFILAMTGTSSKGKTTAGRVAISTYTHPDNYASLNATKGALENNIRSHADLFQYFDESQESGLKPEEKINLLYAVSNGRGKERLHRTFSDEFESYSPEVKKYSILISGEESFLNNIRHTDGLKVRFNELVLSKNVVLWPAVKSSAEAEIVSKEITENHGHIAPLYIEEVRKDLHILYDLFTEKLEHFRRYLNADNDIINRKAKILAFTYLSGQYLARVIYGDEPDYISEVLDDMFLAGQTALFNEIDEFEQSTDTFKDLLSHVEISLQQYFVVEGESQSDTLTKKEIIGNIDINTNTKKIWIINSQIQKFFALLGVPDTVFKAWLNEKELLKKDKDGKSTISRKGKRYYCIEIPLKFFEEAPKPIIRPDDNLQEDLDADLPPTFWEKA